MLATHDPWKRSCFSALNFSKSVCLAADLNPPFPGAVDSWFLEVFRVSHVSDELGQRHHISERGSRQPHPIQ